MIEGESFKLTILLTATGSSQLFLFLLSKLSQTSYSGTKFVLLTSLHETNAESLLQKVYEAYADMGMKNPFHTPEMPIRSEKFDTRLNQLLATQTT